MRFVRKNSAVSHLVGYMLTLSLTTVIIGVTIFTTNTLIDEKALGAAEIFAENIANKIASAIINVCVFKEQYPSANYSTFLEIPQKLVERFSYYIEIDQNAVYVKSSDGRISKSSTIYNVTNEHGISVDLPSSRIYGSSGKINISVDGYNYVHDIDFGTNSSTRSSTRVTNFTHNMNWPDAVTEWKYRTPIIITNPLDVNFTDYQVLIKLDDSNFDYTLANASDLRFYNISGNELDYWIERWYPRDTHTSRIWVNMSLTYPEDIIFMYHGNDNAEPKSNGTKTFDFFDNFTTDESPFSSNYWNIYENESGDVYIEDGYLVIKNGSAINSTTQFGSTQTVIETKCRSQGDRRDASMFGRNDGGGEPYYDHAFLYSSGNFTETNRNLALINPSNENSSDIPLNQDWNRLTYIMNGTHTIICRYFYDNYTVDGAIYNTSATPGDGYFGLCTTDDETTAYYDWIFVRKFRADVSATSDNIEDYTPYAFVCGTDSQDYQWDSLNSIVSKSTEYQGIEYDFICNSSTDQDVVLTIKNLTADIYSMVFTVGDPDRGIYGMQITIGGDTNYIISDINFDTYKKVWITDVKPDGDNKFEITFEDADSDHQTEPDEYYWAVGKLSIQTGKRVIRIRGGS